MASNRHAEIERRAYLFWEREGRPEGKALEHWLRAEREFEGQERPQAADTSEPKSLPARSKRPAKRSVKPRR